MLFTGRHLQLTVMSLAAGESIGWAMIIPAGTWHDVAADEHWPSLDRNIAGEAYSSVMPTLFEVVAEPHRRRMLDLLRDSDRSVNELVDDLGLAQPTVSKHLKALREAGLVVVRPYAQRRWYQLRSDPLRELDAWLDPYRRTWAARLDALQAHLDEMED